MPVPRVLPLAAVLAAVLAAAGCGGGGDPPAVCKQGTKVALKVLQGRANATFALVPVRIDGKGPFVFALDTGAAKSAIDDRLAKQLALKSEGSAGKVRGVAGAEQAKVVQVSTWQVGSVKLQPARLTSLNLFKSAKPGPVGLLGSDVLSRFSSVCIDYSTQTLRLGKQS